jgi:DNA-directed RNA polymerase
LVRQAKLNCVHHDFKTHYGIYNQTKQVLLENTALELSKELSTHGIKLEAKNLLTLEPLPIEIENFCQTEVTSLLLSSIVMNFFSATD